MATRKRATRADNHDGAALVAELERQGISRAKIGGFDLDGVLRGKYVSLEKLRSVLDKGFGFCDVIFGWDVADVLYDNAKVTGWHTGYPDAHAVLDASTLRLVPWEPGVVAFIADFRDGSGKDHPACPRSLLKRVIARGEKLGFSAKLAAEYEFFFFRETRDTLHDKQFKGLTPLDPGMFGYSWVRSGQDSDLMSDLMEGLKAFDIGLEGLHTETGPGVYEAAIRYDDALAAADKAALFKSAVKQIAHRHGLSVTFMAKWNADLPGCSGHLHQSLWKDDKNAFFDSRDKRGMSKTMKHYIAGQMALMQELTAMYSPTINSYKRYVPGVWAPLVASWGQDNRTCAIRLIDLGNDTSQRIEYRQTAADMNPYVAMAASLGAGLWGIEKKLPLPLETRGDPGSEGPGKLPTTLGKATELFAASKAARALFGAEFVDHYARTRDWEVRCFEKAVTDWELSRYFEVI
ncbi:MAG: glutamine synthetase [Myxococcales bacterium]|nr:glutamine synthetase [Myxococcales bacterium]MCB9580661.1 glutamine synthetase [Polyangiaceae bacterium]